MATHFGIGEIIKPSLQLLFSLRGNISLDTKYAWKESPEPVEISPVVSVKHGSAAFIFSLFFFPARVTLDSMERTTP